MRTILDLSVELFRCAKVAAALHERKFKDLVEKGLPYILASPEKLFGKTNPKTTLFDLMESSCGIVTSGFKDLASSPKHMKAFGHN